MEQVVLVDEHDQEIGVEEKLKAHQDGKLHRAFSVFIFRQHNNQIETLLQQRQFNKYHSGGLWTNTCCSHPRPGEDIIAAGQRRLYEEMGIRCNLKEVGKFQYIAAFGNGLTEHELDHVLLGKFDGTFEVNPEEVAASRWVEISALEKEIQNQPQNFTAWVEQALHYAKQFMK